MGIHGKENLWANLSKDVFSEIGGLNSQNVSGISDSNAAFDANNTAEGAVKGGLSNLAMSLIIVGVCLVIGVVGFIIFMCKRKNAEEEDPFGLTDLFSQDLFKCRSNPKEDEKKTNTISLNPIQIVLSGLQNFGVKQFSTLQIRKLQNVLDSCHGGYKYDENDLKVIDMSHFTAKNIDINYGTVTVNVAYEAIVELIGSLKDEGKNDTEKAAAIATYNKKIRPMQHTTKR